MQNEIDSDEEWEVASLGPIYVNFTIETIEDEIEVSIDPENFLYWVEWTSPYEDGDISWSAEPLENLAGVDRETVIEVLEKREIWPWPQRGEEHYKEKIELCQRWGLKEFKHPKGQEMVAIEPSI